MLIAVTEDHKLVRTDFMLSWHIKLTLRKTKALCFSYMEQLKNGLRGGLPHLQEPAEPRFYDNTILR